MQVNDLIANLLATENLTVLRNANAGTACFNTQTRVLTLPIWKDMPPDVESMLVAHEVGHALFTIGDDWVEAIKEFDKELQGIFKGYINVIEDARIEKLMKRRYPGIRKTFFSGYKSLIDRDFFKLKGVDINSLSLIDRINMFFKLGLTSRVKFTLDEMVYVNRAENVETMDEMIQLAQDIFDFSKEKQQLENLDGHDYEMVESDEEGDGHDVYSDKFDNSPHDEYDEEGEGDEGDDPYDSYDEDEDDDERDSDSSSQGPSKGPSDVPEAMTDRNLAEALENSADTSIEYRYFDVVTEYPTSTVVSYKDIIQDTNDIELAVNDDEALMRIFKNQSAYYGSHFRLIMPDQLQKFEEFMTESERVVSYLVKEFEMRKSAQAYKRAQIAKSGSLNTSKLYKYKLTDDIFKRITTVKEGKNHGMIFLLDWSGSMQQMIRQTLQQVINLAMFCRRINVPFEVFAFTSIRRESSTSKDDRQKWREWTQSLYEANKNFVVAGDSSWSMLNLFSSKMTGHEFKTMARRFTTSIHSYNPHYAMGSTPLNEALSFLIEYIPQYKAKNGIEKLSLITLTDGSGSGMTFIEEKQQFSLSTTRKKVRNFARDTKTNKTYEIVPRESQTQTEVLLRMIKDRYNITSLGFYITDKSYRSLCSAVVDNTGVFLQRHRYEEIIKHFKEKGFYSMKGCGRDDFFLMPDTSTKIQDEKFEIDGKLSAATIARKLSKNLSKKRHSRILLDTFIGYVA